MPLTKTSWYAGDTVAWYTQDSSYPSGSYILTVYVNGPVTASFTGSAEAGGGFNVTASASLTGGLTTGSYQVVEVFSSGSVRVTYSVTTVQVLPNPATVGIGFEARSHVRQVYEAIQATLEGRATKDQESILINGRQIVRTPIQELVKLFRIYEGLVRQEEQAERIAKGLGGGNKVLVRFTN